jgi:transcriptional regulator with XRE-family HTH domain
MSSIELSDYLRHRMKELDLSNTDVAIRANISRPTWYRLLNNDITEAKISTLMGISNALDTHLMYLLRLNFHGQSNDRPALEYKDYSKKTAGFVTDITYPPNSIVSTEEVFIKTWQVVNLTQKDWKGLQLSCLDADTRSKKHPNGLCVFPKRRQVAIPITKRGEAVKISVQLTAPHYACTVISDWQIVDQYGQPFKTNIGILHCIVDVISLYN